MNWRKLGKKNHDGQAVDKTQHDGMRHQANEFSKPEHTRKDLQNAHQHDGCEKILNAMLGHQRHHDNSQRAGRSGNHARSAAKNRRDQPDDKGGIKPDQRMHACHKGKGNRLGNQCQRNRQARTRARS